MKHESTLVARLLEPPLSVPEPERKLYSIRVVGGLSGAVLLASSVVLLLATESWHSALPLAFGAVAYSVAIVIARRGNHRRGADLGIATSVAYVTFLGITFALDTGFLLYVFVISTIAFMVYSPSERRARWVTVGACAVAVVAGVVAFLHGTPLFELGPGRRLMLLCINFAGTMATLVWLAKQFSSLSADAESRLAVERQLSEDLLRNILPAPVAERLKREPGTIADLHPEVTVLFADLVGFTPLSARLATVELVEVLNELFSGFDGLAEKFGLEKIKTIGDAYMAAGGLPAPASDHADRVARMALAMLASVAEYRVRRDLPLELRIGLHSGPVIAGVIGVKKFSYDLWGDTVNVASRMESHGEPGRIHVTEHTRLLLGDHYRFTDRGEQTIKGKGQMKTFFLDAPTS